MAVVAPALRRLDMCPPLAILGHRNRRVRHNPEAILIGEPTRHRRMDASNLLGASDLYGWLLIHH